MVDDLLDIFLFESMGLIESAENLVLEYKDEERFNADAVNEIFRVMHTIKGSSTVMMYDNIATVSHTLEDIFYYIRESHPVHIPHNRLVEHIIDVTEFIMNELVKIKAGNEADGDPDIIMSQLESFLSELKNDSAGEKDNQIEISKYYKIFITYGKSTLMSNIKAYSAVYALKEIAEDIMYFPGDIDTNEKSGDMILKYGFKVALQTKAENSEVMELIDCTSGIENIEITECSLEEYQSYCTKESEIIEKFVEEKNMDEYKDVNSVLQNQITENKEKKQIKKPETQSYISVNINKMDELMDLIGEIVIAEAVVMQNPDLKVPGLNLTNFQKASAQLSKITTELQEVIMSMRMIPLKNTFQKMNRTIYDISRKMGKDIELEIIGENTEVDKNIIEHISDPLMHLIRNAADHGIESEEERKAVGKNEKGKIILEAKNEGGKVWIIVQDNGKGLDKESLLKKARESDILTKPEEEYTEKDIYSFITLPGFSMKKEVSEYSGRGVGMDVVMKNIQNVGGNLEIDSQKGIGTTMTLKIPLTLAIIKGIIFRVGKSSFIVSTNTVKEFIRITKEQIIMEPTGDEFVMIREECYPVLRLNEFYQIPDGKTEMEKGVLLILEHENEKICVFVDELADEQEIVVKPLPIYIKYVRGISGCTQLGDGSIGLILDAGSLMHSYY